MFGVPIMVILYFFFIAVSPFTLRIAAKLATFLRLWLVVLWIRKKQDVFFFLMESLSDLSLKTFMCANTNRATTRVKNIERTIKPQKISLYFLLFLCVFAKIGLFVFRRKTKKIKGVNSQNEKSNYLCPLF